MLSMGVVEVVSGGDDRRSSSSLSGTTFYIRLAHQVSSILFPLLKGQCSNHSTDRLHTNCIDLATAYCRVNRARGMDLISPEDLLRACRYLDKEKLPIRLKGYANGLLVGVFCLLV